MSSRQGRMYGLTAARRADHMARVDRALGPDPRQAVASGLLADSLGLPGTVPLMVHGDHTLRSEEGAAATELTTALTIYRTGGIRKLTAHVSDKKNGLSDKVDSPRVKTRSRNRSKSSRKRKIRAS